MTKLHKIESKLSQAERRCQRNLVNKTFGGRDDYQKTYERHMEIAKKERDEVKAKALEYLQKEYKHKETLDKVKRIKKWELNQRSK